MIIWFDCTLTGCVGTVIEGGNGHLPWLYSYQLCWYSEWRRQGHLSWLYSYWLCWYGEWRRQSSFALIVLLLTVLKQWVKEEMVICLDCTLSDCVGTVREGGMVICLDCTLTECVNTVSGGGNGHLSWSITSTNRYRSLIKQLTRHCILNSFPLDATFHRPDYVLSHIDETDAEVQDTWLHLWVWNVWLSTWLCHYNVHPSHWPLYSIIRIGFVQVQVVIMKLVCPHGFQLHTIHPLTWLKVLSVYMYHCTIKSQMITQLIYHKWCEKCLSSLIGKNSKLYLCGKFCKYMLKSGPLEMVTLK